MKLQALVDRLNAECPALAGRARLLRDLSEVENVDGELPAAFVLRSNDTAAQADGVAGMVRQARTRTVAVLLMADPPQEAGEPMEALRTEVLEALLGWQPDPAIQLEYAGGEAQAPQAGIDRWQDTFRYTDHLRGGAQ
ncbi:MULTISPECIES: hypothetical protein [unclassified Thioalkalivibrio]|uniref:phage tail terminator protein n=1 Tax=unclassified Thioalkalivibrio TaxID=2621013 RepID=UPI000380AA4B|nr:MULTISPECIES: hypothetical protein [unclassified Thioalkalivibrio]